MNQIKKGYKQTKVGIIPEDWEVVKLKNIATKCIKKNADESIKTVFSNSALNGIVFQNEYFDKDIAQQDNLNGYYIVASGDFVYNPRISKNAPAGPINRNLYNTIGVVSPLYTVFRVKSNDAIKFLEHFFKSTKWLKYMMSIANYGVRHDRMNITSEDLFNMPIPYPKKEEQEKIAEILTTWDEAITKQEELLKAKELQKKALMQKLLSGEVRFSVFSDEWEEVRLGEIGRSFNGLSGKTGEDFGIGEAKYITYKNIFDYSKIKLNIFENVEISNDEKQNLVQFGDIFFTVSSETPEEVGMSSVLLDNVSNTYLNSFCFGYRLNNFNILDPFFARFYFRSFQMRDKISRLAQGSTRFNLSKNEIMKLKIKLPSIAEQQKIAEVLSFADDEINLLKNELEELKLQKKALMQKLLSGEVRVKG
ncbi:restriction endonuclease subunit S [bacterium]|nr:restriction endonuclease subunit S [bacterium]